MTGDHAARSGLRGHPRGLWTLFFTEMWERFSYYGMRALLVLYMTAPESAGGLGFDVPTAAGLYGWYTFSVYVGALPGGYVADRWLGRRRSVFIGGLIIASGHFCLAAHGLTAFYGGLALIVLGTAFLKPNISTLVGGLYGENDPRRDAGFSVFYMGINIGAFLAPLVCGFFAQDPLFLDFLARNGLPRSAGWHFGFAAAGFGMLFGLAQYVAGRKNLEGVEDIPGTRAQREAFEHAPLTRQDWLRLAAIAVLFCFSIVFWSAFEQAGSSLNLFADRLTDNHVFGRLFPSSWYQSVNSLFIIALAPAFAWLWPALGKREPSSPAKFAWGLAWSGAAFVAVAFGALSYQRGGALVSPAYLVVVYLFSTFGELCLSPVGLSTVTKLAPPRLASLMMGVWFTSVAIGNKAGGWVAGHFDPHGALWQLFAYVAALSFVAALVLLALTRPIKRLMGGVQ